MMLYISFTLFGAALGFGAMQWFYRSMRKELDTVIERLDREIKEEISG
jgi:hypothetical protein